MNHSSLQITYKDFSVFHSSVILQFFNCYEQSATNTKKVSFRIYFYSQSDKCTVQKKIETGNKECKPEVLCKCINFFYRIYMFGITRVQMMTFEMEKRNIFHHTHHHDDT